MSSILWGLGVTHGCVKRKGATGAVVEIGSWGTRSVVGNLPLMGSKVSGKTTEHGNKTWVSEGRQKLGNVQKLEIGPGKKTSTYVTKKLWTP